MSRSRGSELGEVREAPDAHLDGTKTVCVCGEFDSDNLGDQLIGRGQRRLLTELGWRVRLLPLEPQRPRGDGRQVRAKSLVRRAHRGLYGRSLLYRHGVECFQLGLRSKQGVQDARSAILGTDAIVLGGGQLLSDNTLRMLFRILWLCQAARSRGIVLFAFATGARSPRTIVSHLLMRKLAIELGTTWICVRDEPSLVAMRKYLPEGALASRPAPDCAIAEIVASTKRVAFKHDEGRFGLAPMCESSLFRSRRAQRKSDDWWCRVAQEAAKAGLAPVLLCSGVEADHARCLRLQRRLAKAGLDVDVLERALDPDVFLAQLADLSYVLSQRLHMSISYFSLGGVPTSVGWDAKVTAFFERIGLGSRVFDQADVSPEKALRIALRRDEATVSAEALVDETRSMLGTFVARLGLQAPRTDWPATVRIGTGPRPHIEQLRGSER